MLGAAGVDGPPVEGDHDEAYGGRFDDERRAGGSAAPARVKTRSTISTTTSHSEGKRTREVSNGTLVLRSILGKSRWFIFPTIQKRRCLRHIRK
jgi:hypothetical protein